MICGHQTMGGVSWTLERLKIRLSIDIHPELVTAQTSQPGLPDVLCPAHSAMPTLWLWLLSGFHFA